MVFLDTQILFVAFGDIRASFPDVSTTAMSWVLSGYTLVFAALLVPLGRLADRWGRKAVFLGGLGLFTVASAACGLAPTAGDADRRPRRAGRRRRRHHADLARPRAAGDAAGTGADRRRHLGLDGRRRGGVRADDRRAARRRRRLALGVLRQPAGVRRGDRRRAAGARSSRGKPIPARSPTSSARPSSRPASAAVSLALVQSDTWGWVDGRTIGAVAIGLVLTAPVRRPIAASAGPGARPLAVPHPQLPVGQPGDGGVRAVVHGDVPRQRHVPDDRVAVGHRRGRAGDVPGPARRAAARPPVRPAGGAHRAPAADHRRRTRLRPRRRASSCSPSSRRPTTRRRCCRRG